MPSILSVAKLKLLGRNSSRNKKSKGGKNADIVTEAEKEKVSSPSQAPVVHLEIPQEVPELPKLFVPQLSGTENEIISSVATEGFQTPQEQQIEEPKASESEVDSNGTVVHDPEETKLVDVPVEGPQEEDELVPVIEEKETTEQSANDVGSIGDDSPTTTAGPVPEGETTFEEEIVSEETGVIDPEIPETPVQLTVRDYELELDVALMEKQMISNDNHRLEEQLQTTLGTVATKEEEIDRLLTEVARLGKEVKVVNQEKEGALKTLEGKKQLVEEKLKEEKENTRRLTKEREEARAEIQRIKSVVTTDEQTHEERTQEFFKEMQQLEADIESSQAEIAVFKLQIQSQKEKIEGLETRLDDRREENQELFDHHNRLIDKIKMLEEELQEKQDEAMSKDTRIQFLEKTNDKLSASLVEMQYKIRRHTDMLQDQLREQTDKLQRQGSTRAHIYADPFGAEVGRFATSNADSSTISNFTRGIRSGAMSTDRADKGVKILENLNEEIYQVAATLTDKLEKIDKRLTIDDSSTSGSQHSAKPTSAYLKSILGLELIQHLENDAPRPMEDTNPFYLQTALQGCLTACCMRIITSWYPDEWEYGKLLETLYEKIRGRNGIETALVWRKITQTNFSPSTSLDQDSKLVDYVKNDVQAVLRVSGWSSDSNCDSIVESLRPKLLSIVSSAIRLNTMTAVGLPGELEAVFVKQGSAFDPKRMQNEHPPERNRYPETISKDEKVSCVVGIGLKWANNTAVNTPLLLMKPRVVLTSALHPSF